VHYIKFFDSIQNSDIDTVGGKNASLGEMYQKLTHLGVKVPYGFAITCDAYRDMLLTDSLQKQIKTYLSQIDIQDIGILQDRAKKIQELIFATPIPPAIKDEIIAAYAQLSHHCGIEDLDVAVRSSATAEDLPDASFAGQQDTFLNIRGFSALLHHIKLCYASLFTARAISYRESRGYDHFSVLLSIGIQQMVRSDLASSGVMFSIDTESGFENVVFITSAWGLGENVVGGKVNPDEFYVFKPTLKEGKEPIVRRFLGSKLIKSIYADPTNEETICNIATTKKERRSFSINDSDVLQLARYALLIEEHYSYEAGHYQPMDIEWAKDGKSGALYIVQARPETVQSQKIAASLNQIERFSITTPKHERQVITSGKAVGERVGIGKVRLIDRVERLGDFKEGEVLVADNTDPDWEPAMKKASAIITDRGGRTCHAAIVAREIGVPAIVGTHHATKLLEDGMSVSVSCCEGEEGIVYKDTINYRHETIDIEQIGTPQTKIYLNIGNPQHAFSFSMIPSDGVGLARMEFIINNYIKVHPLALYDIYHGHKEVESYKKIRKILSGYRDAKDFFIKKLAEGIGMIAAAFYPKPVIVRTSDFKSNEYRKMVGGKAYEPVEENPMIGYRGASRYFSESYRPVFDWECEALKYVRESMGLDNVKIMIPFVRTLQGAHKVINILNENGLIQGENALEVYAMCEVPSNVILAEEFLEIFDGYSIGSNDLTQLTLGIDRDSDLVSTLFDERNEAVTRSIQSVISVCKAKGKYVGICGQAPSDYPEITEFLVQQGIDSISLNPDSALKMREVVLEMERDLQ
jgi:pyruvate,water dikinase